MERTIQKKIRAADGNWVSVDIYGDSRAAGLIMVPGVMSDAAGWRDVAEALTAWPSVSIVNRRGRSPSGPLPANYSVHSELDDLTEILSDLGEPRALFGWSYGGLISLLLASRRRIRHVIAYEPVVPPFGTQALPALKAAATERSWDKTVEIVNRQVSGFSAEHVEALRADSRTWESLVRLGEPLYEELRALSLAPVPDALAPLADKVDLIIGAKNFGNAPYGTSFEEVSKRVQSAGIHSLAGQGHLAHVQGPETLSRMLDALAGD